jgi:3-oxoadipate enol-lactonase
MRARLNDCDLAYTVQGSGPPVVLVHGFPLNRTIWTPQLRELSRDLQVVTFDLRGHGESEATPGVYTMEGLARDVKALVDHLGLDRIILGGLSMGGYVAFAFLRQFRERVQALILADTKAEADTDEARAKREQQAQVALRGGAKPIADRLILTMLTQETQENNTALTNQVYNMMIATSPIGIAGALRGMAQRADSTPMLGTIRVPTLIIVGEKDQTTPLSDSKKMAAGIKGSELVVIPSAAHLTTLENSGSVNLALKGFLARISAGLAA